MKIDSFTHFMPTEYADRLSGLGDTPAARNIRKRISGIPSLVDLDLRFRQLEEFGDDYRQIISLPGAADRGPRRAGRSGARWRGWPTRAWRALVDEHPDRFAGFVAALPLADVDDAIEEARHAVGELGALGVQIYTQRRRHAARTTRASSRSSPRWPSSTRRSGCTRAATRAGPTTRPRRARSTRSGGRSGGRTTPRCSCPESCSPGCSTATPTCGSSSTTAAG